MIARTPVWIKSLPLFMLLVTQVCSSSSEDTNGSRIRAGLSLLPPSRTRNLKPRESGQSSDPTQINVVGATALGCWSSFVPSALSVVFIIAGATPQSCYNAAKSGHYTYFGLSDGGACTIGNSLRYGATSNTYCFTPCLAQSSALCGGLTAINLYSVNYTPNKKREQISKTVSKGCFVSPSGSPLLGSIDQTKTYSIDTCGSLALEHGYETFALSSGKDCQYGQDSALLAAIVSTDCITKCEADLSGQAICGGPNSASVFTLVSGQ